MKKTLLLIGFSFSLLSLSAQNYGINPAIKADRQLPRNISENVFKAAPITNSVPSFPKPINVSKSNDIVTVINIGQSFNAYGLYNGGRTAIWADNNLKTVAFFHRLTATPGSGHIGYDLSVNGGFNWTINTRIYNPTIAPGANARYPQGVIYNPTGNTNPNNAFLSSFSPILDGSNGTAGSWGGYGVATVKIDTPLAPLQQSWPTSGAFRGNVPAAMTINPVNGDIWVYEPSLVGGLGSGYTDTLLVVKGVFNQTTGNYAYTRSLMFAPDNDPAAVRPPADEKIAFAPDGQIGYMSLLWDNRSDPFAAGWTYYPIIYKTVNGGQTWTGPTPVRLSGPQGMPEIKNYLTAEQWNSLWTNPSAVHRDSVRYTTAFDHDLVVDANGNPHICVTIGVGSTTTAYSIIASGGYGATFHIYSLNQGTNWIAKYITHNKTFRGTFGDISEDSRSQITRTQDGTRVFLSWIDTDFPNTTTNTLPDIYCVGVKVSPMPYRYTTVRNVTLYSDAWTDATFGTASHYALTTGTNHTVPFVYQTLTAGDPTAQVQFKYIPDFIIKEADFTVASTEKIPVQEKLFSISQNFPNPFPGTTQFTIDLNRPVRVSVEVLNLMGQRVMLLDKGVMEAKSHLITLDLSSQPTGLYFYKVKADNQTITRRMILQ